MPWIDEPDRKQAVTLEMLNSLPDWFGIPEYVEEYARDGRDMPCYIHEEEGRAVGFVNLKQTSPAAVEVHVMGILPAYHRRGIGREMIAACEAYCRERKIPLLHVKTVDDSAGYASYRQTCAFYRSMGFMPLEVIPLWDESNPCLLLVKYIDIA